MKKFKKIGCLFIFLFAVFLAVSDADTMQAAATGYTDHGHTWSHSSNCSNAYGNSDCSGCTAKSGYTNCSTCGADGKVSCTQCYNSTGVIYDHSSGGRTVCYVYGCETCGGYGKQTYINPRGSYKCDWSISNQTSHTFQSQDTGYKVGTGQMSCSKCGGDGALSTTCSKCNGNGWNYKCVNASCLAGYNKSWAWHTAKSDYSSVCYTTANTYTVKYNANGGTGTTASSSHTYGTAKALTANGFSRTGYTFLGWSTSSTATTATYSNGQSVSNLSSTNGATVNLYAVWSPNTYTVTYNANGGTGAPSNLDFKYDKGFTVSTTEPTRTGYTFLNWKCSENSITLTPGQDVSGWGSCTLLAQWKANSYTVTLVPNGGTCSQVSFTTTYDTANYCNINGWIPVRAGYTFKGWYTAIEGGIQVYGADGLCTNEGTYWKNSKWAYADNITLYAQWEHNEYTVTYDANGGSTGNITKTYYYEDEIDLSPEATKSGYKFVGWSTAPNATRAISTLKMPDLATSENPDYADDWEMTLYAVYSIEVSDVANHTYPAYEKVKENEVYLLVWEKDNDANYEIYPLSYEYDTNKMVYRYTLKEDLSDFANGLQSYYYQIIAYDNAGNHTVLKEDEVKGGTPQDNPDVPDTPPGGTTNGYTQTTNHYRYDAITKLWIKFDTTTSDKVEEGKTYQPSCITPPMGYRTYQISSPKGTVTLTNNALTSTAVAYTVSDAQTSSAYYMPIAYTLTFDPNGGSCTIKTKTISYGDYYGALPTPTRKGWTSTGWYTAASGGNKISSSDRYLTAGNTTIYAQWTRNVHTVTYDYWTNGGTNVSVAGKDVEFDLAVDLTPKAEKTGNGLNGWTFVGWNTDPDATTALSSYTMPDEDVTLYAIYEKTITVTVKERSGTSSLNTRNLTATIYNNETEADFTIVQKNTWSGWTLLGYTTETEPTAAPLVAVGGRYTTGENVTLHALYSTKVSLTYDTNGSAMTFDAQCKEAFHNVTGGYEYPSFTIMSGPSLSENSFVSWKVSSGAVTDVTGTTVSSCIPGDVVILTSNATLTAQWDAFPEIEAYNRYFTLEQAQNGTITEAELLEKVAGTDREDGTLVNGINVIVQNYNASFFTSITADKEVEVTYQATDSFGNTVTKTVTITVTDTTAKKSSTKNYVRFIGSQFFTDNSGNLVPSAQGGLEDTSIWRTDVNYRGLLKETLGNTKTNVEKKTVSAFGREWEIEVAGSGEWNKKEEIWVFTRADIKQIKNYTSIYGNVLNAIDKFFDSFEHCRK